MNFMAHFSDFCKQPTTPPKQPAQPSLLLASAAFRIALVLLPIAVLWALTGAAIGWW
jgi:hypothetical protein